MNKWKNPIIINSDILLPAWTRIDELTKEKILELIGEDITDLVKEAKRKVDLDPTHSFKYYFKEIYGNKYNLLQSNNKDVLEYILQEKDLVSTLRNLNQTELWNKLEENNTEEAKKLNKRISELNAVSNALKELSRDVRTQLWKTLSS